MEMLFTTKLMRVGSSDSVVIPKTILRSLHWQRGDRLVFGFASGDQLWVRKLTDEEIRNLKPRTIEM